MSPKRQTPFQPPHEVEFGLSKVSTDSKSVVTGVRCQFCVHSGRESDQDASRKRRRTENTKIFHGPPFRQEAYRAHNEQQHPVEWTAYRQLWFEEKKDYFKGKLARSNTLHHHWDLSSNSG